MTGLEIFAAYLIHRGPQRHRPGVDLKAEISALRRAPGDLRLIENTVEPKTIALTFDDGPHPTKTPTLLALLRRLHVHATFFVVGKMAQRYPDLVREEVAEGHEVGNHTFHHLNLDKLTVAQVRQEFRQCSDAIEAATGARPRFCRPPGGRFDPQVVEAATREGMWTVLWTDDPGDFARPDPKLLVARIDRQVRNGGILLLHDGIPQTMKILPSLISELRKRGYRFETCSEILQDRRRREWARR